MKINKPSYADIVRQNVELQKRNRYLESLLYSKQSTNNRAVDDIEIKRYDSPVFISTANGKIIGVFLSEDDAHKQSRCEDATVNIEPWLVKGIDEPEEDAVKLLVGQKVKFFDKESGREGYGTIVSSDMDDSLGNDKIIYYIAMEGFPKTPENYILIFGEEISAISED